MVKNRPAFHAQARQALAGLNKHATALGLVHCTAAELDGLLEAALSAQVAFLESRAVSAAASVTLGSVRIAAQTLAGRARDYLVLFNGRTWSDAWPETGFISPSLRVPRTDEDLSALLMNLAAHFRAHPGRDIAALGITSALLQQQFEAFEAALAAVTNCQIAQRDLHKARTEAERALEKKLRVLRLELEAVLSPEDVRWLSFGERIPGDVRVPDAVEEVIAVVKEDVVRVEWAAAARATKFKIFKQVTAVDAEPVLVSRVRGHAVTLEDLPANAEVVLRVVPSNATGDGVGAETRVTLQAA